MWAESDTRVRVTVGGAVRCPSGGIVIASPFERPLASVVVVGRPLATVEPSRVTLHTLPAEVILHY